MSGHVRHVLIPAAKLAKDKTHIKDRYWKMLSLATEWRLLASFEGVFLDFKIQRLVLTFIFGWQARFGKIMTFNDTINYWRPSSRFTMISSSPQLINCYRGVGETQMVATVAIVMANISAAHLLWPTIAEMRRILKEYQYSSWSELRFPEFMARLLTSSDKMHDCKKDLQKIIYELERCASCQDTTKPLHGLFSLSSLQSLHCRRISLKRVKHYLQWCIEL